MQLFSFTPGQPFRLFKQRYFVTDVRNDIVTARDEATDAVKDFEASTLLMHYSAKNLRADKPPKKLAERRPPSRIKRSTPLLADASEKAVDSSRRKYAYLKAIAQAGVPFKAGDPALIEVLQDVAASRGEDSPPSFSSLSRTRSRFVRSGGDPASCLPRYDLRGAPGKPRFNAAIERVLQFTIDNHHMTIEAESMRSSYDEFRRVCIEKHGLDDGFDASMLPSYSTFRRRVMARSAYEIYAARNGERAAEKTFRHARPNHDRPGLNEVWEIDHTPLDLLVVDTLRGMVAKRPRFTVILEACTRSVMGFDVDFTGDSSQAVLNALCHAITPKTYVKQRYPDIEHAWPCHGAPLVLRCDNGKEFHSESVRKACEEVGIEDIEYCAARRPTSKGRVERFFRTMSEGFLRSLPGYAGPDLQRRKVLEEANLPVIDLETFVHLLHIWVIDVYMQKDHSGSPS
jgi:putative transposase